MKLAPFNYVPLWSPRVWNGMEAYDFGKLLREYRYKVHGSRMPSACVLMFATGMPSIVNRLQSLLYGRKVRATEMVADPIFIIGHWRSGTTLVHELLSLDDQFASPSTFQCFMPRGFLVTHWWLRQLTSRLLPERRPMDNMPLGWDVPQEDEFAMLSMGMPTSYRRMAFPNENPRHLDYLNMHGVPFLERQRWKEALREFVLCLNYYYGRQIVLKSPPHTGRISILQEIFPDAKFIHICRSPFDFIPSTMHMWAALDSANGFQLPDHKGLEQYVFDSYDRLYRGFFRDRGLLNPQNHIQVQFEDLARRPVETMARVYESLGFEEFDYVEPLLRDYEREHKDYRRNRHEVPDALRDRIAHACDQYIREFGFAHEMAAA
ncbi:MAG TPA: sulfotransferase [Pirellulaceae bacterium]